MVNRSGESIWKRFGHYLYWHSLQPSKFNGAYLCSMCSHILNTLIDIAWVYIFAWVQIRFSSVQLDIQKLNPKKELNKQWYDCREWATSPVWVFEGLQFWAKSMNSNFGQLVVSIGRLTAFYVVAVLLEMVSKKIKNCQRIREKSLFLSIFIT